MCVECQRDMNKYIGVKGSPRWQVMHKPSLWQRAMAWMRRNGS